MRVLVLEDDATLGPWIRTGLTEAGHVVDVVLDGRDAVIAAMARPYDVLVLDRMVPGLDGLAVLRSLRQARIRCPAIFLTAMDDVEERVEGLRAGGDDYLVKPFAMSELIARIDVLARRGGAGDPQSAELSAGDIVIDLQRRTCRRRGEPIDLNPKEFLLLEVFMRSKGRVQTRTMLLERVWDMNFDPTTSVVETHISRLRSKIDATLAYLLPPRGELVAFNSAPTRGHRVAHVSEADATPAAQRVADGALCWFADLPGYSARAIATAQTPPHAARASVGNTHAWLDNGLIRVRVLPNGHVEEITDLATGWQALAVGEHGNRLVAFEDRPICWDAWDIDPYFEDNQEEVTNARQFEVLENGPVRAAVRVTHLWRGCEITQTIRLTAGSRRVDFVTEIDWTVSHILLKVAFPVNVETDTALYDIQ
ncbi:MAG: glycoside hydrolase family 38 C-terminal domain-containing protein, partial [Pseudomonadota bacterium]